MTSFGKGTRMCLGLQLGYAEMELVIATLFRRFEFNFFETNRSDVDCYRDEIAPGVHPNSKGVRVLVDFRNSG
jgi:cytochrome P450